MKWNRAFFSSMKNGGDDDTANVFYFARAYVGDGRSGWEWRGAAVVAAPAGFPKEHLPKREAKKLALAARGLRQFSLLFPFRQVLFRQRQMRHRATPTPSALLSRSSVRTPTTCLSKDCQAHERRCRPLGRPDSDAADMDDAEPEKEAKTV
jgi:hypothetical protein